MTYPYVFPEYAHAPKYLCIQVRKIKSELIEVENALAEVEERFEDHDLSALAGEIMDVIHASETALRMIEDNFGVDLFEVREWTIEKNRVRGYYA